MDKMRAMPIVRLKIFVVSRIESQKATLARNWAQMSNRWIQEWVKTGFKYLDKALEYTLDETTLKEKPMAHASPAHK